MHASENLPGKYDNFCIIMYIKSNDIFVIYEGYHTFVDREHILL